MNIEENRRYQGFALFHLGFRPFFILAGILAIVAMSLWVGVFHGGLKLDLQGLSISQWHAHEMIFGYTAVVVAGFLLTAVKNWTGQKTVEGPLLLSLALLWLTSHVLILLAGSWVVLGVSLNMVFLIGVLTAIALPIIRVRQWKQWGILCIVAILVLGEAMVAFGLLSSQGAWVQAGLYTGFYLMILIILVMGRRVIPFFIERGVGSPVALRHFPVLDKLVLAVFVLYGLNDIAFQQTGLSSLLAAVLVVAHGWRLVYWYEKGIWRKPLLWSLYLSLVAVEAGFLLAAVTPWLNIAPSLTIHLFAVAGVGLVTLSMMARVSLGHTGRDIHSPPKAASYFLAIMAAAGVVRVVFPLLFPAHYGLWIGLSQGLWLLAFTLFLLVYTPMLLVARVDGRYG